MMMHPHQSQGMGQMIMRPQQPQAFAQQMIHPQQPQVFAQQMNHPQQPQAFAQQMMHPQLFQGHASPNMGMQQSYGALQPVNYPQQFLAPAPARAPAMMGAQQMPAQQAAGGQMSQAQILSFAHSTMSPMQFLAFAQALTMPTGHRQAMSAQITQAPLTPVQSQASGGVSTPTMSPEPSRQSLPEMSVQSTVPSPGSSTKDVSKSPATESLEQARMPSTPTMVRQAHTSPSPIVPKAQEAVNTAVLMTPQNSQGPVGGMASPQQSQEHFQGMGLLQQPQSFGQISPPVTQAFNQVPNQQFRGFGQGMPASQQFHAYNHAFTGLQQQFSAPTLQSLPNGQAPVITQSSIAGQHASPPAINQSPMIGQGIQQPTIGSTLEATNSPVTTPKELTPYRGIVPPAKRHGQSNQLGMLHKFIGPIASNKNRVTKNTPATTAVLPQVKSAAIEAAVRQVENTSAEPAVNTQSPVSPVFPTELLSDDDDDEDIDEDSDMEQFVNFDLCKDAEDNEEDIALAFARADTNNAITAMHQAHPYGVAPEMQADVTIRAEVDTLFEGPDDAQENFAAVPKANVLSLPHTENNTIDPQITRQEIIDLTGDATGPYWGMAHPLQGVYAVEMRKYLASLEAEGAVANGTATKDAPDEVVEHVDDPRMRIATAEEIDRMTPLEEYRYGIRQGLPNKGYPMKKTVQNASF